MIVSPEILLGREGSLFRMRGELHGDAVVCLVPYDARAARRIPSFPGLKRRIDRGPNFIKITYTVGGQDR